MLQGHTVLEGKDGMAAALSVMGSSAISLPALVLYIHRIAPPRLQGHTVMEGKDGMAAALSVINSSPVGLPAPVLYNHRISKGALP